VRVVSITFIHLAIPFKGEFLHAQKSRSYSDTVLVRVETDLGLDGWGEILARPYVTGESHKDIMGSASQALADALIGRVFNNQPMLSQWVTNALTTYADQLALLGGLELALWSALAQGPGVDLDVLLGPERRAPTGRCITIGFDASVEDLRARAIHARLQRATVVKLKVGLGVDQDIERLQALSQHLGSHFPVRLDGNGTLTPDYAIELLSACVDVPIESLEEPFAKDLAALDRHLQELYDRFHIPLMADESVCSAADAKYWIAAGGYQVFNIRVGKHGGLQASRHIRDIALASGIGVVGGSMVGESGILTQASNLLLCRSEAISYVEGLGQNRSWLAMDPVDVDDSDHSTIQPIQFKKVECQPLVQSTRTYN